MNEELADFREAVDEFLALHAQSPLSHDQRHDFAGLNYYDENEDLIFTVTVERFPDTEPIIQMETSTDDVQPYRRYGRFTFEVNGEEAALTIYSDPYEEDFFLPFRDATNGEVTYGAGRYLDSHRPGLQQLDGDRFEVDFNYSYNPYCAYNPHYSCPLPPRENWLDVPIEAGEKAFE